MSGFNSHDAGLKNRQVFTANGTWNKPAGINRVRVLVVGGGGGGGGVDGQGSGTDCAASGGSAGGYCEKLIDVTSIASSTITVGAGGVGGAAGNNNGAPGGDSVWSDGINTLTANGGGDGKGRAGSTTPSWVLSSAGGLASGGDFNARGGMGGPGGDAQPQNTAKSGRGGASYIGAGARETLANSGSVGGADADANTGAGGSGASTENVTANAAGGDGADGIVIVYEYA